MPNIVDQSNCGNCYLITAIDHLSYVIQQSINSDVSARNLDMVYSSGCFGNDQIETNNICRGGWYGDVWRKMRFQNWYFTSGIGSRIPIFIYKNYLNILKTNAPSACSETRSRFEELHREDDDNEFMYLAPVRSSIDYRPVDKSNWKTKLNNNVILSVAIYANSTQFQFYDQGVITHEECSSNGIPNHAVLIVGYVEYADTNRNSYWIVRNSYGSAWGMNGYFHLDIESNACNPQSAFEIQLIDQVIDQNYFYHYRQSLQYALTISHRLLLHHPIHHLYHRFHPLHLHHLLHAHHQLFLLHHRHFLQLCLHTCRLSTHLNFLHHHYHPCRHLLHLHLHLFHP